MPTTEQSKIVNVIPREDNMLKISYTSEIQNLLTAIQNNLEVIVLEINSTGIRPDFLTQDSFYNALENANNLFLVDVISTEEDINSIADTLIDKLKNTAKQLIIQCRSLTSTKVYIKEFSPKIIHMELISPTKLVTSSDELLTEEIFIEKLSSKNTFALPLVIEALKLKLVGDFNDNPLYHQSLMAVTFYIDKTFDTWKLIDYAVFHDNFLVIRLLSMHDWNLSKPNRVGKTTLERTLEIAAGYASPTTLAVLLNIQLPLSSEKMTIPDDKFDLLELSNIEGNTPLLIAASKGKKDNVDFFLRCGANIKHRNNIKKSALDLARENKHSDIVLILLEADAELPEGFTLEGNDDEELRSFLNNREILHTSIKEGNLKEVKEFVSVNKSKFYFNTDGKSALLTAIENGQYEIYAFLHSKDLSFKDEQEEECIGILTTSQKDELKQKLIPTFIPINNAHILFLVSKSRHKGTISNFKEYVEALYFELDKIPEVSIILEVIRYSSYFDIIFDFDKDHIKDVDPTDSETTKGRCDYKDGRLYVGAKMDRADVLGTLAHELTHFAMYIIYGNDCNPYHESDIDKKSELETITEDMKNSCASSASIDFIIKSVFDNDNYRSAELIVRIPHMLAKYGENEGKKLLDRQAGKLLEYYNNYVIPDCAIFIQQSFLIMPRNNIKSLNEYSGKICNIKETKIKFQGSIDLKDFLQSMDHKILLLNTNSILLSSINVYQTLQNMPFYSHSKNYLFFKLKYYIKQHDAVNKAFCSEASNLLVIEFSANLDDTNLSKALNALFYTLREKSDKKVIFITHESDVSEFKKNTCNGWGKQTVWQLFKRGESEKIHSE